MNVSVPDVSLSSSRATDLRVVHFKRTQNTALGEGRGRGGGGGGGGRERGRGGRCGREGVVTVLLTFFFTFVTIFCCFLEIVALRLRR